jgi:hypothetical protein
MIDWIVEQCCAYSDVEVEIEDDEWVPLYRATNQFARRYPLT